MSHRLPERDRPWMIRTYAGHSTAAKSNELYRRNLAKGQTGLSVAFDLPTQTGYDADHELARGEVGKVGVPVAHKGDMAALLDGIPLDEMNTSMTINATAAWLLALYIVTAEDNGVARSQLQGTTQNDIIKEYLSRGTYAFPPAPSMRLIADMIAFAVDEVPKWNPTNICSYHLQEAGATPQQELAYALCTAIAVLDTVKASGQVGAVDPVLLADGDVERQQPGGGGVDRHRRVHDVERDVVEQEAHVAAVGDGHPDLAHLALGELVVGVVAGLRRQVERDRQARLALREVLAIQLVGGARAGVAGVRAHHPRLVALGETMAHGWILPHGV